MLCQVFMLQKKPSSLEEVLWLQLGQMKHSWYTRWFTLLAKNVGRFRVRRKSFRKSNHLKFKRTKYLQHSIKLQVASKLIVPFTKQTWGCSKTIISDRYCFGLIRVISFYKVNSIETWMLAIHNLLIEFVLFSHNPWGCGKTIISDRCCFGLIRVFAAINLLRYVSSQCPKFVSKICPKLPWTELIFRNFKMVLCSSIYLLICRCIT